MKMCSVKGKITIMKFGRISCRYLEVFLQSMIFDHKTYDI